MIDNGVPPTYCYDHADRLTSTTEPASDRLRRARQHHQIFGETHAYDHADRHLETIKGATTVHTVPRRRRPHRRRKVNGTTVARYGYTATGDISALTLDTSGTVLDLTISLPGGALQTITSGTNTWGYPNLHGDLVATANSAGAKQGATVSYDPYGNLVTGSIPDNSTGNLDYGWEGQHQRPLEHEAGLQPIIEMGARQYSPLLGRFLESDPIEGGSANNYDYVAADPVGRSDLDGTRWRSRYRTHRVSSYRHNARIGSRYGIPDDDKPRGGHRKKTPSKRNKHEKADSRRQRDQSRSNNPNKRRNRGRSSQLALPQLEPSSGGLERQRRQPVGRLHQYVSSYSDRSLTAKALLA